MKKVTAAAVAAFLKGKEFKSSNTSVEVRPFKDETVISAILKLHGNVIARRHVGKSGVWVCDGGWQTRTTKERLNGIPGVNVIQRNGDWFLSGEPWDGYWARVEN